MATFVCRDRLNIVLTRDGSRGCRPVIEGVKLHPAVDRGAWRISHPRSARKGNRGWGTFSSIGNLVSPP